MADKQAAIREKARRELARRKSVSDQQSAQQTEMSASEYLTDKLLFDLPGKASSGLNALVRAPFTDKTIGEEYETLNSDYQARKSQYEKQNPNTALGLSIAGGVAGGSGAYKLAGKAIGKIAPQLAKRAASSYGLKIGGDMALGAGTGAASAFGNDQNMAGGALMGASLGAIARPAIDAARGVGGFAGGLIGVGNKGRANKAVAEALLRSGKSIDDVSDDLAMAARDGQGEYALADAIGDSGQRMLAGVARSPGDARSRVVQSLSDRQQGQGERLASFVSKGLNSPQTAQQTKRGLIDARASDAAVNYPAAIDGANPVNLSATVKTIDDALGVNPILGNTALDKTEIGRRIAAIRGKIDKNGQQLVDFKQTLNVKQDLGREIEKLKSKGESVPKALSDVYRSLDEALEGASPSYRSANDTFRQQSQNIDAVDAGEASASISQRAEDVISNFQSMRPDQQSGFRAGYADKLVGKIDGASLSPNTNKARGLMTGKAAKELPVLADPSDNGALMRQIGREDQMFRTAQSVMGGSKTADNLADAAEIGAIDATMIGNIFQGRFGQAAMQGISKAVSGVQGRNSTTRDMIAKILMETGPTQAKQQLTQAVAQSAMSEVKKRAIISAIFASGNTALAANHP